MAANCSFDSFTLERAAGLLFLNGVKLISFWEFFGTFHDIRWDYWGHTGVSQTKVENQCSKDWKSKLIFLSSFLKIVLCAKNQLSKGFHCAFWLSFPFYPFYSLFTVYRLLQSSLMYLNLISFFPNETMPLVPGMHRVLSQEEGCDLLNCSAVKLSKGDSWNTCRGPRKNSSARQCPVLIVGKIHFQKSCARFLLKTLFMIFKVSDLPWLNSGISRASEEGTRLLSSWCVYRQSQISSQGELNINV